MPYLPSVFLAGVLVPRAAVRVFAMPSPFGIVRAREVITGYGDHQRRIRDMASGPRADSRFLIAQLAHSFVDSLRTMEPVREIEITGHADRVWADGLPQTADEQRVSEERARDVEDELLRAIRRDPAGRFTGQALQDALDSGLLRVLTVGMGARQPLRLDLSGATPENRRVEIKLLTKQSIDI